jgi:hypothetical protein
MKTNYFENRNYGLTITIVAILLLLLGGFSFIKNHSLKNQLKDSKIKTEAMVSENLSLTKTSEKLKADIKNLMDQNKSLNESIESTNQKINIKEAELSRLRGQNANASILNKKVKELEQLKSDNEKQIVALNQNIEQLNQKNKELSVLSEDLQKKNDVLVQNNQVLIAMEGNNYKTEALRGKKGKLTIKASRTKKIVVNLDVPSEAAQNIKFKVKTPAGKEFSSATDKNLTVNIPKSSDSNQQSNSIKLNGEVLKMSKIELIFAPEKKLEKGIVSFDIFNNEQYVGSTHIRLK